MTTRSTAFALTTGVLTWACPAQDGETAPPTPDTPSERAQDSELRFEEPAPDKSGYHLFHPTPRELRRPVSADRPDLTESPYTVDAGAVQIEMSFLEFAFDDTDSGTDSELVVAPTILKFGLTNNSDLQLVWAPLVHTDAPSIADESGAGNLGLRLKVNLYGNDHGPVALGFLPFIEFPTGDDNVASDEVTGGFALPLSVELPGGWGLGTQVQFNWAEADGENGVEAFFSHTLVLSHAIAGDVSGYIEYFGEVGIDHGDDYSPVLSTGLVYELNPNTLFDAGLFVGLDDGDVPDLTVFAGLTIRF